MSIWHRWSLPSFGSPFFIWLLAHLTLLVLFLPHWPLFWSPLLVSGLYSDLLILEDPKNYPGTALLYLITHWLVLILSVGIEYHANAWLPNKYIQDLFPKPQTCLSNCLFNNSNQMPNCHVKYKMFKSELLICIPIAPPSMFFLGLVNENTIIPVF